MGDSQQTVAVFSHAVEPRLVLRVGLAIAVFLAALSWLTQLPQSDLPEEDISRNTVNVDAEASLPAWASSAGLLTAAAMMVSIAHGADRWRKHWLGLAILFVALSIDEAVSLHEKSIEPLRNGFDLGGAFFFAWVVPAGVAVAILALILWRFVWALEPSVRWILLMAAGVYLGGALGMELVGGSIADSRGQRNATYVTVVTIEELLEMAGIAIFLYGLTLLSAVPHRIRRQPMMHS